MSNKLTLRPLKPLAVCVALILGTAQCGAFASEPARDALPRGGKITGGDASILQRDSALVIEQKSQKLITDWDSFDIGRDASVTFIQPNADASALNRIHSVNPTQIFGQLNANGKIYLVNAQGIIFGRDAQVNVGSLVASTLNLSDQDYLNNTLTFHGSNDSTIGRIENYGQLAAAVGGTVALLSEQVINHGTITSPSGQIYLAAGQTVSLDLDTSTGLSIDVSAGRLNALVENHQAVIAAGGQVILTARGVDALTQSVVNNQGLIEASSLTEQGGRIILEGDSISLTAQSVINATGASGGGEILIGGDWQGGANAERRVFDDPNAIRQAVTVTMAEGASIDASATDNGDGGTVVLWSDISNANSITTASGSIYAKGGQNGGDGGQIETSGARLITAGVTGSAAAPHGKAGEWLFDPYNIEIISSGSESYTNTNNTLTGTTESSKILNTSIESLLNAGTSVTVSALTSSIFEDGHISISASINKTAGADATLTFKAGGYVYMVNGASISSTSGKLNLIFWSEADGGGSYGAQIGPVTSNGGHVWVGGGAGSRTWNGLTVGHFIAQSDGLSHYIPLHIVGNVNTAGGDIFLAADDGYQNLASIASINGNYELNAVDGDITLLVRDAAGGWGLNGTTLTIKTTGALAIAPPPSESWVSVLTWSGAMSGSTFVGSGNLTGLRIDNFANLGGLRIGDYVEPEYSSENNNIPVAISSPISIAGSLFITGGYVEINSDLTTTQSGSLIRLKSLEYLPGANATDGSMLVNSGADLTTNSGDIILWANPTNRTAAYGQANNEIVLAGTNIFSSAGGKIVIAGGLDNNSDGIPDGYAYRGSYIGEAVDIRANVALNSGGGEIIIRGEQNGSAPGVGTDNTFTISNAGSVVIEGKNTTTESVRLGTTNIGVTDLNESVHILATTHIKSDGLVTINTNGGAVTLASNTNNSDYDGGSSINGQIRIQAGLSITTNGGNITLGGGNASGSSYAMGQMTGNIPEGIRIDGSVNLDSRVIDGGGDIIGGGDIALRGKTPAISVANGFGGAALMFHNIANGVIYSGKGTILLDGFSQSFTGNAIAGILWWNSVSSPFTIQSENTTSSAITINGYANGDSGQAYGIESEAFNTINIFATGDGGGITINTGSSSAVNYHTVLRGLTNILSKSGPIKLSGTANGRLLLSNNLFLGSKANTAITSSDSNILVEFDRFDFSSAAPYFATSGAVTLASSSTSFGANLAASWFKINQNSQTMSGFTIGKDGNTANLTIDISLTAAGPISLYGKDITVNGDLNTTAGGDAATILLKAAGNITQYSGKDITTDGADVIYWADSDRNNAGYINFTGSGFDIITNGGDVIMAGGAGDTQPTGYAHGGGAAAGVNFNIGTSGASSVINATKSGSTAGNIIIRGKASGSYDGVYTQNIQFFGYNLTLEGETDNAANYGVRLGSSYVYPTNPSQVIDIDNDLIITAVNAASSYSGNALRTGSNPRVFAGGNITINSSGKLDYTSTQTFFNINPGKTLSINFDGTANFTTKLGDPTPGVAQGKLSIAPYRQDSFTSSFNTADWTFNSNLSGLTIGKSGNSSNIVINKATIIAGPITIFAGDLAINSALTGSSHDINLHASGNVTQTAAITAAGLGLNGTGNFTLTHSGNSVTTLAGGASNSKLGTLSFVNSGALTVGTVNPTGITATGDVNISTVSGDLTVTENISTDSTSATAITLNAGSSAAAGTAAGGNILLSGTLTTGTGGRTRLFSGAVSGSTGVTAAVGSGSGNFRYNADETTDFSSGSWSNIANSGTFAIYREQPTANITDMTLTMTYGDALPGVSATGTVNGDGSSYAIASAAYSTANQLKASATAYTISSTLSGLGYNVTGVSSGTLTVNVKALDISGLTASNKTYDALLTATLSGTAAITGGGASANDGLYISSDTVSLSGTPAGSFADKNVGVGKTVSVSGLSLTGADAGNYTLNSYTLSANISKADLTVTGASAANKVYDATTAATVSGGVVSALASDVITLSAANATFADKNVGSSKAVTTAYTISGTDAGNYNLIQPSGLTANITAKQITVIGITASTKVYDAGVVASLDLSNAAISAGASSDSDNKYYSGDSVTLATSAASGAFATKSVGTNKAVTVSGLSLSGADAGNYTVSDASGARADITPLSIAVTGASAANKVYDASTAATVTGGSITALSGDTVSLSAANATFANKNVGTAKAVTTAYTISGADAGNYTLIQPSGLTANITAKALDISGLTASNKTYDTLLTATLNGTAAITGGGSTSNDGLYISTDTVSLSGTPAGSFADKNVGVGKTVSVSGLSLSGTDAGNYTLNSYTLSATISKADLTVTGASAANKVYDASTAATVTGGSITALSGDTVSLSAANATFADKNVGSSKAVTTAYTITGTDAGNYNLIQPSGLTANITAKALNISGLTASNKTYDTLLTATLNGTAAITGGGSTSNDGLYISTDTVSLSGTPAGSFADKNVGVGKTVSVSGLSLSGTDAGNYTLNSYTLSATISKADLTVTGASAANKVYDATTTATVSGGVVSALASDVITLSAANATFADKNVGTAKAVTTAYTISGTDAGNYNLIQPSGLTANITAKALDISGLTASNKTYDALLTATLSGTAAITGGGASANDGLYISSDTVSLSGTPAGSFADKNVGAGKTVSVSGLSLSGTDAGNYTLNSYTLSANISKADLTVTGASAANKVYDASTTASVSGGSISALASDVITLSAANATFADKNAGTAKVVTTAYTISGTDAGNYTLVQPSGLTANITPKTVSLSAARSYDGTTDLSGVVTITGLIGLETLSYSGATANSKHVASANNFISAITLVDGTGSNAGLASNYALPDLTAYSASSNNVTLTAATLTPSLTNSGVMKVYDGTTNAPISLTPAWSFTGLVAGDNAAVLAYSGAAYDSKDVSMASQITVSGLAIDSISGSNGSVASDYVLGTTTATVAATITPAPLTVLVNDDAKFLTQADTVGYAGVSYVGFVGGESANTADGFIAPTVSRMGGNTVAGTYAGVLIASGASADNYSISYSAGDYTIVPSDQLLVRVNNVSDTYGTATQYQIASAEYFDGTNVVRLDDNSVSGASVSIDAANQVTVQDGASGSARFTLAPVFAVTSSAGKLAVGSYQLGTRGEVTTNSDNFSNTITVVGWHQVNTKAITASASGVSKTYDGTTSMNGVSLSLNGLESADVIVVDGLGAFGQKDAGTNLSYTVSNLTLSGADAANYHLSGGSSFTGNDGVITARQLTLSASKTYDGTDVLGVGEVTFGNLLGTETLTYSGATVNDKHVATANKFINAITLGDGANGGLASNYVLPDLTVYAAGVNSVSIAAASLTPTLTNSGVTKVYDGTSSTSITPTYSFVGLVSGDVAATLTHTDVAYNDSDVADANKVTVSGLAISAISGSNGSQATDYILDATSKEVVASISKATLTVTADNQSRVYGDSNPTFSQTITGFVNAEDAASSGLTGTATGTSSATVTSAVGNAYVISASTGNLAAANYEFTAVNGVLTITARPITVITNANQSKIYGEIDPALTYTVTADGVGSSRGLANGDSLTGALTRVTGEDVNSYAIAQGTLTNANNSNYAITFTTADFAITPRAIGLTADSASKIYGDVDPTLRVTVTSTASNEGIASTDSLADIIGTLSRAVGENVGSYDIVLGAGLKAANYSITFAGENDAFSIIPRTVTLSASRVYDGTTDLTGVVTIGNLVGTETLTYSGATVNDKHVATVNKFISAITLGDGANGGLASNYALPDLTAYSASSNNVTLTAATLTPSLTNSGVTKVYDGSTTIRAADTPVWSFTGLVAGDNTAVLAYSGAAYDSKDVSSASQVTVSGLAIDSISGSNGSVASDYVLGTTTATVAATITPAPLTVLVNDDAKFLTQADTVGYAGVSYVGFVGGETANTADGFVAPTITRSGGNTVAGTYAGVLIASGAAADNYSISYSAGDYTIVPSDQLLVRVTPVTNVYGDATQYQIASAEYFDGTNVVRLDDNSVSGASVSIDAANQVTVQDGASGSARFTLAPVFAVTSSAGKLAVGSYQLGTRGAVTVNSDNFNNLITVIGAHSVSAKGISASASGVSKVYDGTTSMTGVSLTLNGLESGDAVTVDGVGAFAQKDVGTSLTYSISNLALSGADADNYYLASGSGFSGSNGVITPRLLSLTASKTYDGTVELAPGEVSFANLVGTETLTYSNASVHDKHVATAANFVSAITLADGANGGLASNYVLPTLNADNAAATITPATLVASISNTGVSKVYDGSTAVPDNFVPVFTLVGLVDGDSGATLSHTAMAYNDHTVATANKITVSGLALSAISGTNGSQSSDYVLDASSKEVAATIRKAMLTVTADNHSRVYGEANPLFSQTISGFVNNENALTAGLSGSAFGASNTNVSTDVGDNHVISAQLGSLAAENYDFALVDGRLSITPRVLTVTLTAEDKVYDGSAVASLLVTDDRVNNDALSISYSALFESKNVGSDKAVSITDLAIGGAKAGNYILTGATSATAAADITRLSSVTWVGGTEGDWFDPANWAGGAVPDLSNVANVIIPAGVTVRFNNTASSPATAASTLANAVNIDSLGSAGSLSQTEGFLTIGSGGMTLAGYTQSGGTTTVAGDFTVTNSFSQGSSGSVTVGGNVAITDTAGGLVLGNLSSAGTTSITSTAGSITQAAETHVELDGAATFIARNGQTPASYFDVVLDAAQNVFGDSVTIIGDNVTLAAAGDLDADVTAAGDASLNASGDLTAQLDVTGNSTLDADGDVSVAGSSTDLTITSGGATIFGTTTLAGDLVVTSTGDISQTGALAISGTAELSSTSGDIVLADQDNSFADSVTATANTVVIAATGDLNTAINAVGDAQLTIGGNLIADVTAGGNVSLTSGGRLTVQLAIVGNSLLNAGSHVSVSGSTNDLTIASGGTTLFGDTTVAGNFVIDSADEIIVEGELVIGGNQTMRRNGQSYSFFTLPALEYHEPTTWVELASKVTLKVIEPLDAVQLRGTTVVIDSNDHIGTTAELIMPR